MNRIIRLFFLLLLPASILAQSKNYAALVNPFIGTGGFGHTYPGATMPFGMVQLSPDTRLKGWEGCSGYHYSDTAIYGFSHTHLNGTGVEDYCDILLMPTTGPRQWKNEEYKSGFSHSAEKARAGYYAVRLNKYDIGVELTSTLRTGLHRYQFPDKAKKGNVLIDLSHRDIVIASSLEQKDSFTLTGMRQSKAWASKQTLFFAIRFSKPIRQYTVALQDIEQGSLPIAEGTHVKAYAEFELSDGSPLLAQVAISAVSTAGALKNLEAEFSRFDFERCLDNATSAWNKELGKIEVEGGTGEQQTVFYTALYHASINPNLYTDVDGRYRGLDDNIHSADDHDNYTVFSLWDTHRAYHPLMTILNQKRTNDWVQTFLSQDEQGGMLPVWELSANETFCMIGYHSVSVILDAYKKGIRGFDAKKALAAMVRYADSDRFGLNYYRDAGYVGNDKESESVSKTLEYAYDDWCIAEMARLLGDSAVYKRFTQRAQSYKNLYDPQTGHMRGKLGAMWYDPFDPREINHFYTEGNSWQYSFSAQQDIAGLVTLHGGREKFAKKLEGIFTTSSQTTGRNQADVTGLIGQYAHGNEPSHHISYLFNFVGQPWKTQYYVNRIVKNFYRNDPEGLIGNEDCGQMSAWYILSALGFYPVTPGSGQYIIGTPLFDKVTLHLENGKSFTILANRQKPGDFYIQSLQMNGQMYTASYLNHSVIVNGGTMEFQLGTSPSKGWGTREADIPSTQIKQHRITAVPYIDGYDKKIREKLLVPIKAVEQGVQLYYALTSGNEKPSAFKLYTGPIRLTQTATVHAYAMKDGIRSKTVTQEFYKVPTDRTVQVISKVNRLYTAGGPEALVDGVISIANFRNGEWQGYEGIDFVAVVDLKQSRALEYVGAHFLQDIGSWIWMPRTVKLEVSEDGVNFQELGSIASEQNDQDYTPSAKTVGIPVKTNARFIRVTAYNYGVIPDWHPGKGGNAHIFVDAIIVR